MHIGRPECARDLVVTYRWAGGDPGDDALVSFLAAYRAWVRAVVACERAAKLADAPAAQTACEDEARRAPTVVERRAPAALLMRRADARLEAGRDPSDAGAAVVLRQIGECDPLPGRWLRRHLALRTDLPLGLQVSRVENFIDRRP